MNRVDIQVQHIQTCQFAASRLRGMVDASAFLGDTSCVVPPVLARASWRGLAPAARINVCSVSDFVSLWRSKSMLRPLEHPRDPQGRRACRVHGATTLGLGAP